MRLIKLNYAIFSCNCLIRDICKKITPYKAILDVLPYMVYF